MNSNNVLNSSVFVLIAFGIIIVIFLIIRGFWLWYWKINRIEQLLERMTSELEQINKNTEPLGRAIPLQEHEADKESSIPGL